MAAPSGKSEFIKNLWYVAGFSHEIDSDALLDRTIVGERLVFFRASDGKPAALRNRCSHRSAPLSTGRKEGDCLRCGYHGLLFDTKGTCVEIPGQDVIPPRAGVRSYPVEDRGGWLWVWMGDAEAADPATIPALCAIGDPDWDTDTGCLHYQANAYLLHDNLLDFSHLTYVHEGTFSSTDKWGQSRPAVTRTSNGFKIEWWLENIPPSPLAMPFLGENPQNEDALTKYSFELPGVLVIDSRVQETGAEPREAFSTRFATKFRSLTCEAVTPETDTTSHFFYSNAIPAGGPDEVRQLILQGMVAAFEQDRAMIEAQQALLLAEPGDPISVVATTADAVLVQMRGIIRRRLEEEQSRR